MNDSTRRPSGGKSPPRKPKDFPLSIHKGTGYWCRKIRGHVYYFGRIKDDPTGKAALELWLEQRDDLLAGREPRRSKDELTVAELCNAFLTHKESLRDSGELHARTFLDYYKACEIAVKHFGRTRPVADVGPDDFRALRTKLGKTLGLATLANEIGRIRSIFRFGFDEGLVMVPVRFGKGFGKPRQEKLDEAREAHRQEHGPRMFEADEVRMILAACGQPLKSMVLIAANTGFGNTDLACLPIKAVDLDAGWVTFPRVKTAVPRRVPLWPKTIDAIREWLPMRPKPLDKADAGLLFLTRGGKRWVHLTAAGAIVNAITQEFDKVLRKLGLKRSRVSFYALRHTFETIAGETLDQIAVDCVMGHKIKGMKVNYIERIGDDRLRRVVDHVHDWLFAEGPDDPAAESEDPAAEADQPEAPAEDKPVVLKLFAG